MQFDYIIGNPPYQYPKGAASPMAKLYIDISLRIRGFVKETGSISFVTPKAILYSSSKIKDLLKNLTVVDYSATNFFRLQILIVAWQVKPGYQGDIITITKTKRKMTPTVSLLADDQEEILIPILNKVNYKQNGRRRMRIRNASSQKGSVPMQDCHVIKDKINQFPVYCQRTKFFNNIGYTKQNQVTVDRLVIPFGRKFRKGNLPKIRNMMVDEMFYLSLVNDDTLKHQLEFISSKLVTYCVNEYVDRIKNSGFNEFLGLLPELDFTKEWTNVDLYKEFNLSDKEIKEIERWYNGWQLANDKYTQPNI